MRLRNTATVLAWLLALSVPAAAAAAGPAESLPVAAVTIYPGEVISDNLLSAADFPAGTTAQYPVVADRAELAGKVARRTLLPGKLIARNAIAEPQLVVRGSITRAVYLTDQLVISTPVLALQSGALAALIQVRNIDSGKVVAGTVQADGTVRVGGQ
jgi:flagella basal body P-ring formation protein FlgA